MADIAIAEGSNGRGETFYLHGDLEVRIIEAKNLPNMDMFSERLRRCFAPCREAVASATQDKEHHHRKIITSDPYVTVCLAGATVARTRVITNEQNPQWDEHFVVAVAHPVSKIEFQVKDNDIFGAQLIGTVSIPVDKIQSGQLTEDWYLILNSAGNPPKPDCELRVSIQFTPFESNPLYQRSIAADPEQKGIRGTYFPVRKGGKVTLYQDAHVLDGELPDIELEEGDFRHEKCWEDICHAILEAHHLIYIVGWSVYHKVKLVRESKKPFPRRVESGEMNLGELLKYKSEEGVRVLMLVWDDKTSHSKLFINTEGMMATHDEETRKFFKHSSVICILSPRYASNKLSYFKQKVVGTLFTHHQKCLLVDTQGDGNKRKITAFIGGLDLCDGRYDTPKHRLYRDLDTIFKDDYHNPTVPTGKGPRQPWHDLHCRIEGPAAYDVLKNFEQRWQRATRWHEFKYCFRKESRWQDDAMIKLERISWILSPSPSVSGDDPILHVSREDEPENWHVQVFRSIDSGSLKGFHVTVKEAEKLNLVCGKNLVIDKSIHTAYVKAIRSAQHFIYIENQYFLGSSFGWPSYKNADADNLIPVELALKIVSKIKAKERFAVYIVIPMWPEGDPKSAPVQEILFWQGQTIQMMYDIIARELRSMGVENSHPEDYLNFYCLGNREEPPKDINQSTNPPSQNGDKASGKKFPRFMIYVHAKGMIVDDEYVILGSANINQRSLDGSRDTEIAMGAYQPHHTWARKNKHPRGQVYGYRMSLWAEHLGHFVVDDPCFKEPQSLECVKRVNELAKGNWKTFAADEPTELQEHLLKYPIKVDADGKVGPLPNYEEFPDFGGKVLGAHATSLPDGLTM